MERRIGNEVRQDLISQIDKVESSMIQLRIQIDLKVEDLENLEPEELMVLANLRSYLQYFENLLLKMAENLQEIDELYAANVSSRYGCRDKKHLVSDPCYPLTGGIKLSS